MDGGVRLAEIPAALELDPPPHNGFGTEEDSRLNCFQLCPKAPIKPLKEFQNNDGKVRGRPAVAS